MNATLRDRARRTAERFLLAWPFPALLGGRNGAVILAWHNVVPAGERARGDGSLHLPQAAFAAQLDALVRTHRVLPLNELLAPGETGPRAAITFDDGYRGAVSAGVEELSRRGLPATFFVVSGAAAGERFWWDVLAGDCGLSATVRAQALGRFGGRGVDILKSASSARAAAVTQSAMAPAPCTGGSPVSVLDAEDDAGALPWHATAAGDHELRAAAAVPGITLGSHTASHPDLSALEGDELRAELRDSIASLRSRFPSVIPWISYPYGRTSPAVAAAAREAGYEGGLRVEGGAVRAGADPFALPRVNVPAGVSADGFALRARGVEMGRWRASW
jgi:peptidoglycan/xylan/chitin deacetylase (PgdA/CDA1 family)